MKSLFLLLLPLLAFSSVSAQSLMLEDANGRHPLEVDRSSLCVYFEQALAPVRLGIDHPDFKGVKGLKGNSSARLILDFAQPQQGSAMNFARSLGLQELGLITASWAYIETGVERWLSPQLTYLPNAQFEEAVFEQILSKYPSVTQKTTPGNIHLLQFDDAILSVSLSNELFATGMFSYVHPDFILISTGLSNPPPAQVAGPVTPNDTYYDQQYYLHNTGVSGNGLGALTADVDIDAPEAWCYSLGAGVLIGVVDEGVQDHEDLEDDDAMGSPSRVLTGYNATTQMPGGGSMDPGEGHGQCVAGIMAASHNNIGVAGIAPEAQILPVYIPIDASAAISEYADAISWAYQNGADIVNNSWAFQSCIIPGSPGYAVLETAITNARTLGRNGKGCVVVFPGGQHGGGYGVGGPCIFYPGNIPEVLTIGGIKQKLKSNTNKNVPNYCNVGPEMDVVAPTSSDTSNSNIRCIDRMGDDGYNETGDDVLINEFPNTNYTRYFGGTSTTSAEASGVVALLLGFDPTLTESQLVNLIIGSAVPHGNGLPNNNFGYGIINAHQALLNAGAGTSGFPVEMLYFTGEASSNSIELSWATASETEHAYFSLEKEIAGVFTEIGRVAGQGTTLQSQTYAWSDVFPFHGKNSYRLIQVDQDGQQQEAARTELNFEGLGSFGIAQIYPNPAYDQLAFRVFGAANQSLSYQVLDLQGRTLMNGVIDFPDASSFATLEVGRLPSGMYLLQLRTPFGQKASSGFLVEK